MRRLMRKELQDDYHILELQNCILNIAEYIHMFCEEHGIDYCLMGGSALGALRHKGFIPWDDDLDIFMTPANYEKFREAWYQHGNKEEFYLQQFGNEGKRDGLISMAKLRMNKSSLVEDSVVNRNIHHGVYVDIFILHTCPDNVVSRYWQYFWAKYIVAKDLAYKNYMRHGKMMNIALKTLNIFPRLFLVHYALKQIYKYRNQDTVYYCHFLGRAWMKNGLYKREYFKSTRNVDFETIQLKVPFECERYLSDRWGDYMKLPSKEQIAYFQHASRWSTDKYFENYNKDNEYPDEKNLIV